MELAPGIRVAQGYDFGDFGFVRTQSGVVAIDAGTAEYRVRAALAALTELRDQSLAGLSQGLTLTRLLKAGVLPEVLREHPAAVGPYLVIHDHFVRRRSTISTPGTGSRTGRDWSPSTRPTGQRRSTSDSATAIEARVRETVLAAASAPAPRGRSRMPSPPPEVLAPRNLGGLTQYLPLAGAGPCGTVPGHAAQLRARPGCSCRAAAAGSLGRLHAGSAASISRAAPRSEKCPWPG